MKTRMIVNVVILTYHPDTARLSEIIRRLNRQTLRPSGILIVNTEDGGRGLVPEDIVDAKDALSGNVRIINISDGDFDHGATRHMAMKVSGGDYVIMMTQDALPVNKYLLENLIGPMLGDESVAVSYARQLPYPGCGETERYARTFNYPAKEHVTDKSDIKKKGIKAYFCSNVCAAYRMSLYGITGGFPEKTIFNEDCIYAAKALNMSYRIYYAARACVYHSHNYGIIDLFKRYFDIGVSHAQFPDIFNDEVMKAEREGAKLTLNMAKHLLKIGRVYLVPYLCIQSAVKYIGYRLGRNYAGLPEKLIILFSMNDKYWL